MSLPQPTPFIPGSYAASYKIVARLIGTFWIITIAYWVILAFGNKRTRIRQSRGSRLAYFLVLVATIYFLSTLRRLNFLLLPINPWTQIIGLLACAAGLGFAIWARRTLGRNWSGFVSLKENHELIQHGPYKIVRNPLYSGLILAITGTTLALHPTAKGFLIDLVWVITFYIKARHEERFLVREFGAQYAEYKQRVGAALIPFVL